MAEETFGPERLVDAVLRRYDVSQDELRSKPHIVSAVVPEVVADSHNAGHDIQETLLAFLDRILAEE